ncbi:tetratricopeptide repeat protein [Endothiovibrio diazotrophicus]
MSDSPYIVDVTKENIAQVVLEGSRSALIVVDFWAPWCQPCQSLLPVMHKLAEEYAGGFILAKVNIDEEQELAAQFGVRSVPTVKFVFNGQLVDEFSGALPESQVRTFLERHLGEAPTTPGGGVREQAAEALAAGDEQRAIDLLAQAHQESPDDHAITLDLAGVLAQLGEVASAEALLKTLPAEMAGDPEVAGLKARLGFAGAVKGAPATSELEAKLAADPDDHQARHSLAARKVLAGDLEGGMEQFLEIMRRDGAWNEGAGRVGMLAVFDLLGGQGPVVAKYRRKMFAMLH